MNKLLNIDNKAILREEKNLNWDEISNSIKLQLGRDIFESWIKKIELYKEYNH